jgi:hypothetical protein
MNHQGRNQFSSANIRRADARRLGGRIKPGHGEFESILN